MLRKPSGGHEQLIEGAVWMMPSFISEDAGVDLMEGINREAVWTRHVVKMFGNEIPSPRLTAYQANSGVRYSYSGIDLDPAPWTTSVRRIRSLVQNELGCEFNSVLINKYRSGSDSMGWHADDEPELGAEPVIASVSLGAARRFLLRHNHTRETVETMLTSGSLLVMEGRSQHDWKHSVPKTRKPVSERINLTFRRIKPSSC